MKYTTPPQTERTVALSGGAAARPPRGGVARGAAQ